jgi:hypothetical protein
MKVHAKAFVSFPNMDRSVDPERRPAHHGDLVATCPPVAWSRFQMHGGVTRDELQDNPPSITNIKVGCHHIFFWSYQSALSHVVETPSQSKVASSK